MWQPRVKGVCWCKQSKKWKVRFGQKFIAMFESLDDANQCAIRVREALGVKVKFNYDKESAVEEKIKELCLGRKEMAK